MADRSLNVEIVRGHTPGVIERAVEMQALYYTRPPGFNQDYETHLTRGLTELELRIGHKRNQVWTARAQDKIIGTIFIMDDEHARLTSFIVDDGFRGMGIGRQLLTEAVRFVDEQKFDETRLWTFEGSDAARRLYESSGFVLYKQSEGEYFGKQLTVQLFVRKRNIQP